MRKDDLMRLRHMLDMLRDVVVCRRLNDGRGLGDVPTL